MTDTKNIILLAALRLFLQNGYKEITMQDILEASGQAKGTFYYHFKNKAAVFQESARYLIMNYMIVNFGRLSYDSVKGFIDSLYRVRSKYARMMLALGDNFKLQIMVGQASMRIEELGKTIAEQQQKEHEAWTKALQFGRESGEITTSIPNEDIAKLFMDIYDGVNAKQLRSIVNIDTMSEIRRNWDNIYSLITR